MHEVRDHLQEESVRAESRGDVTVGLDVDAVLLREGQERLGRLFGDERQVDPFPSEGQAVRAAQQEQGLDEVDRAGVDRVEAFD